MRTKVFSQRLGRVLAAICLSLLVAAAAAPVHAASTGGLFSKVYAAVSKSSSKVVVKDVDYDRSDREVEFEFKGSVKWKSPKVKITSYNGSKTYKGKITDKDSDELEYKLDKKSKLTYGKWYRYKITGVKNKKGGSYQTVTGTFRAVDD